jgi:hypothetical protein
MKLLYFIPLFFHLNLFGLEETFSIFKFNPLERSFAQVGYLVPVSRRKMVENEFEGKDATVWIENYSECDGKSHKALLVGTQNPEHFLVLIKKKPQKRKSIAEITNAKRAAFFDTGPK